MIKLSIIIPAYNEEFRIINTLNSYYNFFYEIYKNNFEIIVVANNCKDKTTLIVKKFMENKKQVKLLDIVTNVGKGGAIIEGFNIAKGELLGFVDADNSTKPEAFNDLILNIKNNDGIIASRWMKKSKVSPKQSLKRRIASRTFNILIRLLFKIKLSDTQCGAKLFKKEAIKNVIYKLGITRWAFDIDLLYLLKRNNFKIIEIPTVWSDAPGSNLNVRKASFEMFLAIIRLRFIYSPFKFIVKLYDKIMVWLK